MEACRKAFTETLLELAKQDKDIIAVTTDARGSVTLGDYAKELPKQFVECGIAEQDAVGISAGLAHSGKKVFCCGPACFYVARSLEQVKVDLAYSENPVTILGLMKKRSGQSNKFQFVGMTQNRSLRRGLRENRKR